MRTPEADLERFLREELALAEAPEFDELAAYVDGELGVAEREGFQALLAADPALAADVESLAELRAELAASGRLREPATAPARRLPRRYLAAAATLAVALGLSWLATRGGRPEPSAASAGIAPAARVETVQTVQPGPASPTSPPALMARVADADRPELDPVARPAADRFPANRPESAAGSFEAGSLAGWSVSPAASLDFESGCLGPSWTTPRT